MAVVYLHKRNDTNEVFYVGIGKTEKRAFSKRSRNAYWKNIVEKVGYIVDILVSETPWEDACKIEKLLIEKYGRKDLGLGNLVNMTDGGDGIFGCVRSKQTRQKISETKKGKVHKKETKEKISETKKGKTPWNKGVSMSEETKKKLSDVNKGEKHPMFGKKLSPESIAKRTATRKLNKTNNNE